jgi:hypothetical protein
MDVIDSDHDPVPIVIDDDPTLQRQVQIHTYIRSHTRTILRTLYTHRHIDTQTHVRTHAHTGRRANCD